MFKKYIRKCVKEHYEAALADIQKQLDSFFELQRALDAKTLEFNSQAKAHNDVIFGYTKEIRDALLYLVNKK